MSTREIWRLVPGTDLLASSEGFLMVTPWLKWEKKMYGGVPTRGQWDGKRYIYSRREHKTLHVARLVCLAFHGPPPEGKPYCLHKDENARNNKPDNLKWGTQKENLNAPGFIAYCKGRTGENSPTVKGQKKK